MLRGDATVLSWLVMFACCAWPPRDQIDVRYIYIRTCIYTVLDINIYISFFRDSVTIDFIRCLLRSQVTTYKVVQNKMQFAPIILFMMGSEYMVKITEYFIQ